MRNFSIASTLVVLASVAMCGSMAYATVPPSVLWQDNFTGQVPNTSISTLGWSTIPGTNALTSYQISSAFNPPWSVRAWGMGGTVALVYGLYQPVTGMNAKNNQTFHFKAHQANGTSQTMYDEVRVQTSAPMVLYWRIAERQAYALVFDPNHTPHDYSSAYIGDWASDNAWHDFDISYTGQTGAQTVTFKLDGVVKFSPSIPNSLGYITQVQFVQQGGIKPSQSSGGESHLIGDMAVGSSDPCTPPAAPTGIAASPATICSGESSTLSVNPPGTSLTTDWFTGSCGGTRVANGVNSVNVSPTATTTYYARTRNTADGCLSTTCASVTVTIPDCDDGNACTTDTCSNGVCVHTNNTNACEDDGNVCTDDVCSNGVCTHPNKSGTCDDGNACTTNDTCQAGACVGSPTSGNACDDGNACTDNDTCQAGTCVGTPFEPCDTSNGFDSDRIFVIRGGTKRDPGCQNNCPTWDSEVRLLDETQLDCANGNCATDPPVHRPSVPSDRVYHMDAGPFGTVANDTWPAAVKTPRVWDGMGQDQSIIKSICFTNSPVPTSSAPPGFPPQAQGHAAAGTRFFGVYDVLSFGEVSDEITYWGASFQIVELDSSGRRIRVMQVGLAANIYNDNPDPLYRNVDPDLLTAPRWGTPDDEPWVYTRNNVGGCRVGTIRYNPAKNTLCVAAVIAEFGINTRYIPADFLMGRPANTPAYPRFRIYEFELPDWPIVYYQSGDLDWNGNPIPAAWVGEPVPQSDPINKVRLVQIYEVPGNIQGGNGNNRNPELHPAIDFDNDGNMYCTGVWCDATTPPGYGRYCWTDDQGVEHCDDRWMGAGWQSDVVKVNTLGHRAGRQRYVIPVTDPDTGQANENLVVQARIEDLLGHTHYFGGEGLVVRKATNELLVVPNNACDCVFTHVFDLNTRIGGGGEDKNELVLKKVLGGNIVRANGTCIVCDPPPGDPECPVVWYFQSPVHTTYAAYDEVSGRTFFTTWNKFDCGGVQNFMCLDNPLVASPYGPGPYTVWGDLGYNLTVANPDQSWAGNLKDTWDAASPPGRAENQFGACCNTHNGTCDDNVSQTDCYASGGLWQGKGTHCGDYPCPGQGACCTRCGGGCSIVYESQCTGPNSTWNGPGSTCVGVACDPCSLQPMDIDCDGDVDQLDFAAFEECFNPAASAVPAKCQCFDKAPDPASANKIDTYDYGIFEACASGPGIVLGNVDCATTVP